jgi:hypothetical protein
MSFIVTIGNQSFQGRKGRKLLCPLKVTVTFNMPPPPLGPCVLRVSVPVIGPFSVQPVPGLWTSLSANTVQSNATFSGIPSLTLTPFAGYFFADDLNPNPRIDNVNFTIEVIDTGTGLPVYAGSYPVTVTAQAALNKTVVFVLDRTASMSTPSGSVTRLQRMKAAVTRGLGLFTAADTIGIVSLDHKVSLPVPTAGATLQMPLQLATDAVKAIAAGVSEGLIIDPIAPPARVYSAAIDLARAQSATATVLLLTDGVTSQPRFTTFPASPQVPPPASALFLETPVNPLAPNLCSALPGAYTISAPGEGEFAIEKLLSQILIDLGGSAVVSDPDGSLGPGDTLSFPLALNETDRELELIVFSNQAELLEVRYVPPRPEHGSHPPDSKHGSHPPACDDGEQPAPLKGVKVQRIKLPALTPEKLERGARHSVEVSRAKHPKLAGEALVGFTFLAAVKSDLMLDAYAAASGREVGAELLFSARLTEYGLTVHREGVVIHLELRHPDGEVEQLPLRECSPGRFEFSRRAFRAGIYSAHFIATGRTLLHHRAFRREALRSVIVFEPGTTDRCCQPHPKADQSAE